MIEKVISELLKAESSAIANLIGTIEKPLLSAVDICCACTGRVIVSGIGKSGLVGRKISATLASTGTSSAFIHAGEALHGDLGMIHEGDCALLITKSGCTPEILQLIPPLKRLGVKIILITARPDSSAAKEADIVLDIGVSIEAEPIGIVPTTSTIATMAVGDALAIAMMTRKGFTKKDFAMIHPAGNLGHLLRRVSEVMHSGDAMPAVPRSATVMNGILEMSEKRLGHVIVAESGKLMGIFSDGDLRRAIQAHPNEEIISRPISEFATKDPVTIDSDALVEEAVRIMETRKITALPVLENASLVGIVHLHDLLETRVV
ncbi:MAG TPA: KpsF/GutQ family sugar-phosphate isomerase [candidate division Zixibacteria bacterium]|nr:KpsF/GutQ family sugar-phosphate isomerase [candidate division Zixibacteria bacterium]